MSYGLKTHNDYRLGLHILTPPHFIKTLSLRPKEPFATSSQFEPKRDSISKSNILVSHFLDTTTIKGVPYSRLLYIPLEQILN